MDWKHLLAYITGTVDQDLPLRNEYLVTENRILRNQLKGRLGRVSDMDFGLAVLHDLVGVTAGGKPRNDPLSLSFSRRPQNGM